MAPTKKSISAKKAPAKAIVKSPKVEKEKPVKKTTMAKPKVRIQTAEGWKRAKLRELKAKK